MVLIYLNCLNFNLNNLNLNLNIVKSVKVGRVGRVWGIKKKILKKK